MTKAHQVTLYSPQGGVKYKGQVRNDAYDGWGRLHFKNGSYSGYWASGKRHGYGEETRDFVGDCTPPSGGGGETKEKKRWVPKSKNFRTDKPIVLRTEKYAGKARY